MTVSNHGHCEFIPCIASSSDTASEAIVETIGVDIKENNHIFVSSSTAIEEEPSKPISNNYNIKGENQPYASSSSNSVKQSKYSLSQSSTMVPNLDPKRVYGTSTRTKSCFTSYNNTIAYALGAGVVVAEIMNESISSQTYFCVNNQLQKEISQQPYAYDTYSIPTNGGLKPFTWDNTEKNELDSNTLTAASGNYRSPGKSPTKSMIRDKVKSISCISLSSDGKLLAVGEVSVISLIIYHFLF